MSCGSVECVICVRGCVVCRVSDIEVNDGCCESVQDNMDDL